MSEHVDCVVRNDAQILNTGRVSPEQAMANTGFVDLYAEIKKKECHEFQEIITPWEREVLMFNV